ncbi:MAG TPA: FtsX-like permease family protein [Actinomycetes bacterium]|nr:FtsX-like permease family protein [Actinomycetes bacterium]
MSRWLAGWAPLLRIARRDALRARGRSALIVVMIALPVVTLTWLSVLHRTQELDPDELVDRQLGQAQALVLPAYSGGPVLQAPDPFTGSLPVDPTVEVGEPADPRDAVAGLTGYRLLVSQAGTVEARTPSGVAAAEWTEVTVGDPANAGRYVREAGRAPREPSEVAVTPTLLDHLGAQVGDTVELSSPARELTVTGVVRVTGNRTAEEFFALPGTLIGKGVPAHGPATVRLVGDRPVSWADVQALNAQGVIVYSRHVVLDPPPRPDVPFYEVSGESDNPSWVFALLAGVMIVALAALEVTLLAGAAFAVGTRRQARALALVAAAGGSRRDVRRVVLAGGLVLGGAASIAGIATGVGLAAASKPLLMAWSDSFDFGRFDVPPWELAGIAALGVVTGLLAAVLPARSAARQDPVAALGGRRGQVRTPRKVPAIGLVITAVGIGMAALGSSLALAMTTGLSSAGGMAAQGVAALLAGGAALAQLGLIICSPAVIGLAARWSGRLPLAARLALRDAGRHRGRSAPALAAILTAVTGSTALLLYVAAIDASDREAYQPSWPAGHAGLNLQSVHYDPVKGVETVRELDPDRAVAALRGVLPGFDAEVVPATVEGCFDQCAEPAGTALALPVHRASGGYLQGGSYGAMPVGGAATLSAVTGGVSSRQAERVLDRGGVVSFVPGVVRPDGTVRFEVRDAAEDVEMRHVSLPGAYLRGVPDTGTTGFYSPQAAERLGLDVRPSTLLLDLRRLPTRGEEEAARAALVDAGIDGWLTVERGYVSDYALGLMLLVGAAAVITLGATGIATGLAQADARADHATLAAVGAAPGVRRRLASAQALSLAALGSLLGIASGFVPALALIGAVRSLEVTVPWLQLSLVLVGIPLLAGALAFAFTRSRVPLERRIA